MLGQWYLHLKKAFCKNIKAFFVTSATWAAKFSNISFVHPKVMCYTCGETTYSFAFPGPWLFLHSALFMWQGQFCFHFHPSCNANIQATGPWQILSGVLRCHSPVNFKEYFCLRLLSHFLISCIPNIKVPFGLLYYGLCNNMKLTKHWSWVMEEI